MNRSRQSLKKSDRAKSHGSASLFWHKKGKTVKNSFFKQIALFKGNREQRDEIDLLTALFFKDCRERKSEFPTLLWCCMHWDAVALIFLHWNVAALMVSALKCYCFDVVCNEMLLLWYCLHWNVVTLMLSALKCFYSTVVCIEMLLLWCCLHWNVIALILSALKYCYSNVVCIKMLLLWCCLHLRCCFSAFGRVEVLLHYSSQSSATEMWLLLLDIVDDLTDN